MYKRQELVSGSGAELFDAEGRRYIALNELSVCLGAGNRHFIEVMQQALSRPAQSGAVNPYKARLYERLLEATNGDFSYIHLTSSGSEAAEWAVKLARKLTGKTEVVSYWNSIHGRTQLSASMSGLPKRKTGYGPLDPGVLLTPYPDCLHCPFHCEPQSCRFACLDFLSQQVTFGSAQEIAAVVIELCQGASHLCPPPGYLRALRAWTRERGALLIFDEIQSGMGPVSYTHLAKEAEAAGADYVGAEDMVQRITGENFFDYEVVIATPDMMGVVGRLGKILGPKGLMPNPKAGTVTPNVAQAIADSKAGRIEYRLDKTNIIHCPIGKASFGAEKLGENFNTLLDAIVKAKPASSKGQYIKSCVVASTMGPGIRINPSKVLNAGSAE